MENLSTRITKLRKKNNLSQEQLAEKINVSSRAISKWENGESDPSIANLVLLGEVFNVSLDYLLGKDEIKKEKPRKSAVIVSLVFMFIIFAAVIVVSVFLALEINYISHAIAQNFELGSGVAGVGPFFDVSELTEKTIAFAKETAGVDITPSSDTFAYWQTQLLGKYTLHGDRYIFNSYIIINYAPLIIFSVLVLYLLFSLAFHILVFVLLLKMKVNKHLKPITILSFVSLDLPLGFIFLNNTIDNL